MWIDRNGRPVSPPSNHPRSPTFRKVHVSVEDGLSLGLMIRGGMEYGLGIYITGVDDSSAADRAGLQFGDQIISMNDMDFTSLTHDEAVALLEASPRMSMVVRSVGKVPHSNAEPPWPQHRLSRKSSPRKRDHNLDEPSSADRRLDHRARKLLSESQRMSLAYYCNEYESGSMSIEAFVTVLLEELDTPEKFSLMTDIRALVPSADLGNFDELIYRRELQIRKSKESMKLAVEIHAEHADNNESPTDERFHMSPRGVFRTSTRRRQQQDKRHLTVPSDHPDDICTPSEDSGVDIPNGSHFQHGSRKGSRVSLSLDTSRSFRDRKPSPSRLWRTSPRPSRRSFDAAMCPSLREPIVSTARMRRTAFRRHSSGGEGGSMEDRRNRGRSHEDRRWSLGSEMVAPPYDGHLDAARAVLSRLEAIALTQRRRSPVPPRSPMPPRSPRSPRSPVHMPLSPNMRSPVHMPMSPNMRSPVHPPLSPNTLDVPHIKVRRHRSLPDPHAIQARKKQQQLERTQHRSASVKLPGHRTIPEGNGRFRIIVKKTRPLLGIAIEGGADTAQPLPRIISIHNSGAAFEAGGLQVGHIIVEVDGIQMSSRTHHDVAQLIAHAFYGSDRDQVEFVVIETKPNMESQVRRTSIMVLD